MQSHVADHFYVSITQLLIQIDDKRSTETWSNIATDEVIVAFYCSLQQVFTFRALYDLKIRDESLNNILWAGVAGFNEIWHMMEE